MGEVRTEVLENLSKIKMSRGDFLHKAPLVLGVAVGTGLAGGELSKEREMLETEAANFLINYQVHAAGNKETQIPNGIKFDAFFPESYNALVNLEAEPEAMLGAVTIKYGLPLIKPEILKKLTQDNELKVVFTDVDVPNEAKVLALAAEIVETAGGMLFVVTHINKKLTDEIVEEGLSLFREKKKKEGEKKDGMGRRTALQIISRLGGAWMASKLVRIPGELSYEALPEDRRGTAAARLIDRLNGMASMAHPEELVIFFRNAVMAYKMLRYAQEIKENGKEGKGKKPNFYVEIGAQHGGIEYFLQAGVEFCLKVIQAYPKEFRLGVAAMIGGGEHAAARLCLEIPRDFGRGKGGRINKVIEKDEQLLQLFS